MAPIECQIRLYIRKKTPVTETRHVAYSSYMHGHSNNVTFDV